MKHFLFKGHKISYVEEGAGEPLVFLHNGGNDHRIWDHQIAHFSKTHRVIAIDLPGFGESDKPRIDYTLPLYVGMVETLVDELELAPVNLIGNCMGGAMSLAYAARHPDRVRQLILFNVASEQNVLAGPLAKVYQTFSKHRWLRNLLSLKVDLFGLSKKETAQRLRSQFGANPPDDAEFTAYIHQLYNRKGQIRVLYNNLSAFDTFRPIDEFERPKNGFPPVCLFWGKENFILPATAGEKLRQRLQPEQAEWLDGCGHLPMREKPEEVNRKIEEFLAKQDTRLRAVECVS
ncbi:MAG: alpha/beta fold hydrolase [Blastocatellia bacterium]